MGPPPRRISPRPAAECSAVGRGRRNCRADRLRVVLAVRRDRPGFEAIVRCAAVATAVQAAEVANDAGAARLALVHLSSRYAGDATPVESEAAEVFEGECAFVPDDGESVDVPFPE